MIEQLFFIVLSIVFFIIIFFKMIRKNDTVYVPILGTEFLGFVIDFIFLMKNGKMNVFIKIFTYAMSIVFPLIIILLEKINIDILHFSRAFMVNFYITIGDIKKAKAILIDILEKDNQNYEAHRKLAKIFEKEGGIRKAIDEYVQCIELNKKDYASYYKVATLLTELDRKDEAIQMLNNLIAKKPDYYDATIILGDLLIDKQRYKEAVNIYLEGLRFNPTSYDLNYNLGIVYTMLNDFQSAKECYEKAAQINSLAYNAKYNLAQIALLYKELEKAERYFEDVLNEDDLSADCYFELAKINIIKGEWDLAIKYSNIAVDIDSKRIAEKIKKEPLFMTIRAKISIPFNLEEKEELPNLTAKEKMVKKHLEETTEITSNMGYVNNRKYANERNINKDFENEF